MHRWRRIILGLLVLAVAGYASWRLAFPKHRVEVESELVMLGDLDGDRRWTGADERLLEGLVAAPASAPSPLAWRLDLNRNGLVDEEDRRILTALVAAGGDPYAAEALPTTPNRTSLLGRRAEISTWV